MALATGTRIGAFEILGSLGAGGMGEVYRAHDARLNRDVAIKVLPEALAGDTDRLSRFHREAQVLASLNHPNIAIVHGFEEAQSTISGQVGTCALVMELVDGPTLADRILSGPLEMDEAISIAQQIADALDAAHEHGVVHRDLKPSNIKIRPDGTVKVLDFGLAKMMDGPPRGDPYDGGGSHARTQSPTVLSPAILTGVGMIFGTAAYMSPEQARGKTVDTRADIWAFGCVLYEMLTARRAFGGDEISDTLAAVLKGDPDWTSVPAGARTLVQRCLEKDPKRRLRDIGDAMPLLVTGSTLVTDDGKGQSRPLWLISGLAVAALVAAVSMAWIHFREQTLTPASVHFQLLPPEQSSFDSFTFSPNGRTLAFVSGRRLWVHSFETSRSRPIADVGSTSVFWSPDSRSIAFTFDGKLRRIGVADEHARTICDVPRSERFGGGTWSPDGVILFGGLGYELFRVSAEGGVPTAVTALEKGNDLGHVGPVFLPDGQHFLYFRHATRAEDRAIYLGSIDTTPLSQRARRLVAAESRPMFAANGGREYLVFLRAGTLFAQPFDSRVMTTAGDVFAVAENVGLDLAFAAAAAVAGDGTLAYRPDADVKGSLISLDRSGGETGVVAADVVRPQYPRISPDGNRVALVVNDELWEYDLRGRPPMKLATGDKALSPLWTRDGKSLVYESNGAASLRVIAAEAGASSRPAAPDLHLHPHGWSPDGKELIAMHLGNSETGADIVRLLPDPSAAVIDVVKTKAREGFEGASVSLDGRWLAYTSDTTGALELWVRPLSGPGSPVRISPRGGIEPVWARNGRELFYLEGTTMMSVTFDAGQAFDFKPPVVLFDYEYRQPSQPPTYDVGVDGRFLVLKYSAIAPAPTAISVITNWAQNVAKAR
jgi:serine/threonine protein kinase